MKKKKIKKGTKKDVVVKRIGSPPMYDNPNVLQKKIDQYFIDGYRKRTIYTKDGDTIDVPDITISDLVIYLGFCDRASFYNYEKKKEFSHTIKRARTFIEREYETMLKHGNCTGAIFALKNFGWKDTQEIDHKVQRYFDPQFQGVTDDALLEHLKEKIESEKS